MFRLSVDYNSCIRNHFRRPEWTEEELFAINQQVSNFRNVSFHVLGLYQVSAMGTSKRHGPSHPVAAINGARSLEYLNAGGFKSSHKKIKSLYRKTTKNRDKMSESLPYGKYRSLTKRVVKTESSKSLKHSSILCLMEGRTVQVRTGKRFIFHQFPTLQQYALDMGTKSISNENISSHVLRL